jgi:hypothetical protein
MLPVDRCALYELDGSLRQRATAGAAEKRRHMWCHTAVLLGYACRACI